VVVGLLGDREQMELNPHLGVLVAVAAAEIQIFQQLAALAVRVGRLVGVVVVVAVQ
jgi:hypothetical protein